MGLPSDDRPVTEVRWLDAVWDQAEADGDVPDPKLSATTQIAHPADVHTIVTADVETGDGRSEWSWFRLPDGTLIFGCFPQGETYFATEERREV